LPESQANANTQNTSDRRRLRRHGRQALRPPDGRRHVPLDVGRDRQGELPGPCATRDIGAGKSLAFCLGGAGRTGGVVCETQSTYKQTRQGNRNASAFQPGAQTIYNVKQGCKVYAYVCLNPQMQAPPSTDRHVPTYIHIHIYAYDRPTPPSARPPPTPPVSWGRTSPRSASI
jgi:hypothetical protein